MDNVMDYLVRCVLSQLSHAKLSRSLLADYHGFSQMHNIFYSIKFSDELIKKFIDNNNLIKSYFKLI